MLRQYAKMVETTHEHNQSLIKHMESFHGSEQNYDSSQINTFEDELLKMRTDLEGLREAEC